MSERVQITRWIVLAALGLATVVMLAVSVRGNYLYGYSLGQTPEKAEVFAWASVASDVWKAFGLIAVSMLWRARHRKAAVLASVAWLLCLLFGLNSALGLYVQDRTTLTGVKDARHTTYEEAQKSLAAIDAKRAAQGTYRSSGEIEAEIDTVLGSVIKSGERVKGSVASVSRSCTKIDAATAEACQRVARLRQELAGAIEANVLDERATALREEVKALRGAGGSLPPDPVAEFYAWLAGGVVSVRDISFGFPLFFALLVEVVSAFGPLTIAAYAEATLSPSRRETDPDGMPKLAMARHDEVEPAVAGLSETSDERIVVLWIAERAVPTSDTRAIGIEDLHRDYAQWCAEFEHPALPILEFEHEFDCARELPDLKGKIRKFGRRYYGLALQINETRTKGVRRRG